MGFKCGIVGLPNVGKSTLFNVLVQKQAAEAANYPFCTIEPNVGRVSVPDKRLEQLALIANSAKLIYTQLEFVDIAGLVKGASSGEGLGNKFLGNIREVDAIIHVLRCFEDDDIIHVDESVDPVRDMENIEIELRLSDIESMESRIQKSEKKNADKIAKKDLGLMKKALDCLEKGQVAKELDFSHEEIKFLNLLTLKPVLYVCNVANSEFDNEFVHNVMEHRDSANVTVISAKIEEEILESGDDREEFLEAMGMEESGLDTVIRKGYEMLSLITFFTVGPKEARAWTVRAGTFAPQSAGVIHSDFEKGFIRAEVIKYEDYIKYGGENECKVAGKKFVEGKEYIIQDGDIVHFRFNN